MAAACRLTDEVFWFPLDVEGVPYKVNIILLFANNEKRAICECPLKLGIYTSACHLERSPPEIPRCASASLRFDSAPLRSE